MSLRRHRYSRANWFRRRPKSCLCGRSRSTRFLYCGMLIVMGVALRKYLGRVINYVGYGSVKKRKSRPCGGM